MPIMRFLKNKIGARMYPKKKWCKGYSENATCTIGFIEYMPQILEKKRICRNYMIALVNYKDDMQMQQNLKLLFL